MGFHFPVPTHFDPKNWPLKLGFRGWRPKNYDLQTWVDHLAPVHQSTWKKAGIFEAILNSTYKIKRKKDLVCGLAEKWCCETNTFVFPWGEATITLEDVLVLGGFSVLGDSVFTPLERKELREVEVKLEKERMGLYDYSAGCRTVIIKAWLEKFMKSGTELEHEAFLVFWLSRYVLHNTSNNSVNKAGLSIAIRLARGIRVALAPAVLAHIYKDLSVLKMTIAALSGLKDRNEVVKFTVMSPFHLVQVWAWERFVELRPVSNVVSCAEPRSARWDRVECLNVGNVRNVLAKADFEMEKWVLVGPDLDDGHRLMSFAMFLSVAKLVGFDLDDGHRLMASDIFHPRFLREML
ncbi:serine/threonine-protein phosphatase 7 long form homolog [Argentina anserina]|uniref:serine/threonine-protein phosphatase 7 long form homolog n=1 Tax=Argentina anserina TaxID=57926 RepID=UPI0021768AB3|nr:serine/threonine-protein phosphatase 7 long form homolog [Potentilla anserina]